MTLESVVEDIREQARAEADQLREEGQARADELIEEAEADAEALIEERKAEIEREAEQLRERERSSATLEAKQLRLEARREALDSVRSAVETRLAERDDTRHELTSVLFEAALEEFEPEEDLIVHPATPDEALVADLVSDEDRLTVGDPVDRIGGVVVEGTDTRMRVDNSLDAVIDEVWDDNLRSISESLFEE